LTIVPPDSPAELITNAAMPEPDHERFDTIAIYIVLAILALVAAAFHRRTVGQSGRLELQTTPSRPYRRV
jgi:hypothetical protein